MVVQKYYMQLIACIKISLKTHLSKFDLTNLDFLGESYENNNTYNSGIK